MNKTLRDLLARKAALVQSARAMNDAAAAADRDFTPEEQATFASYTSQIASVQSRIDREQALAMEESDIAANVGVTVPAAATISVTENVDTDPRRGFKNFGEYARAVQIAGTSGNSVPSSLLPLRNASAPGTFGSELAGADSGFLVPPQFANDIFQLSIDDQALLPLTDNIEITSNAMVLPKDETTPWGTDGITVNWQGEGTAGNPVKPKLGTAQFRLKKLMALVPITDELLEDTNALTSYLPKKVASRMQWKINDSILFGNGAGVPLGALAGNAAVTVAKDSGQATMTLSALNLANMVSRLPEGSFKNAVWIINNNVLPALFTLTLGNYPIYLPLGAGVGGVQGSPYGMLLGRPVYVSQHANTFSSVGDVNLVDLSYYQTVTKVGGVQTATSMHLYFDADATAFRTIFRMDGQSKILNPITPNKGSLALSPFVQLAAR